MALGWSHRSSWGHGMDGLVLRDSSRRGDESCSYESIFVVDSRQVDAVCVRACWFVWVLVGCLRDGAGGDDASSTVVLGVRLGLGL